MAKTNGSFLLAAAFILGLLMAPGQAAAAPNQWDITPKDSELVKSGKLAAVKGQVYPEGTHLVLRDISVNQPIHAMLVSVDRDKELTFKVFKDTWDNALLEGTTKDGGEMTFRFRTGGKVGFQITGPEEAAYELYVWLGPELTPAPPPSFVSMTAFKESGGAPSSASPPSTDTADKEDTAAGAADEAGSGNTVLYVLLAVIIVLLAGIAFMLFRGQQKKNLRIIFWLAASLSLFALPALADSSRQPKDLTVSELLDRLSGNLHKLKDFLSGQPDTGNKQIDALKGQIGLGISVLEQTGLINAREAAVQPNYNPDDLPPLPSRCYEDPTGKCGECFNDANINLLRWRKLLEDLFVIYKTTMLETGRIIELADAAAGLSPYANFAWKVHKVNPSAAFNKSKAKFFSAYDTNYKELIKRLNDTLIDLGKCERKFFDEQDWYSRYGMPYYLYMKDRYKRG